jgi:hypothetical protein
MRVQNRIQVALVLAILLILAGIILPGVWAVRDAAARAGCHNNLRQLSLAIQNYRDSFGCYPRGTVLGTDLPAERRLSGYVDVWPYLLGGYAWLFDRSKPWDDEANSPTRANCKTEGVGDGIIYEKRVMGELPLFLCKSNPKRTASGSPSLTHYVGVAGVGVAAGNWPVDHPSVGLFGYDRAVRPQDVKDGHATTLAFIETARDNGPWTAGGPATVRGLDPNGSPYLDEDGQFTAFHRGVNAAFLDGTVRTFSPQIDPRILEALATIAGGEEIHPSDY